MYDVGAPLAGFVLCASGGAKGDACLRTTEGEKEKRCVQEKGDANDLGAGGARSGLYAIYA